MSQKQRPLWVLALTAALVGGFLAWLQIRPEPATVVAPGVPVAPETPEQQAATPKGSFRFYDLLVTNEVQVEVETAGEREKDDRRLFLQVASFRSAADADSARARLLMLNFDPAVETTSNGFHRLIVGPFDDQRAMFKAQDTLVDNGFEILVLRR